MNIKAINDVLSKRKPFILGYENFSEYAVLVPLIRTGDELSILFEVRSKKLRRQPGEICFPGGRIEETDKDEKHSAIRETVEELGVKEEVIKDVVPLDYLVNPFGRIIYPFVGTILPHAQFHLNKDEVEEVFTVPISYLLKTGPDIHYIDYSVNVGPDFPVDKIPCGKNYKWQIRGTEEHFYYYEDKVIWGLTARILSHFLKLIKDV